MLEVDNKNQTILQHTKFLNQLIETDSRHTFKDIRVQEQMNRGPRM